MKIEKNIVTLFKKNNPTIKNTKKFIENLLNKRYPKTKNYETFAKVNPTVDIACFNHNNTYMLFGRKKTDDKLRLVGGFVDVTDSGYEEAAKREFLEETSVEIENLQYITSELSTDWRFRESDDKIITALYYGQVFDDRKLKASDDIIEVRWVDLDTLFESNLEDMIVDGHVSIVVKALEFVTKNNR